MKRFMSKKRLVTAGIVGTLLVGGAVAYATIQGAASGGGSGGTTGGSAPPVPVTISVAIASTPALVPGGPEVPVTFDVSNASTTQSALVTSISQIPVTSKNGTGNYGPVSSSNADVPSRDQRQSGPVLADAHRLVQRDAGDGHAEHAGRPWCRGPEHAKPGAAQLGQYVAASRTPVSARR